MSVYLPTPTHSRWYLGTECLRASERVAHRPNQRRQRHCKHICVLRTWWRGAPVTGPESTRTDVASVLGAIPRRNVQDRGVGSGRAEADVDHLCAERARTYVHDIPHALVELVATDESEAVAVAGLSRHRGHRKAERHHRHYHQHQHQHRDTSHVS